jgi:predicted ATPase
MRLGLTARRTARAELAEPYFLALQAEVYGKVGQSEQAFTLLTKALAAIRRTGERRLEAELYRLKGQLTLQKLSVASSQLSVPNPQPLAPNTQHLAPRTQAEAEAEACFHQAIEIARRQQARSLELRATVSLARLWQQQGKQHAARNTLSEIYGWFTEGFTTPDLQDAKAVLAELPE